MPALTNDPNNPYLYDTAVRVFDNGKNAYAPENDTPEGLTRYNASLRNQVNAEITGGLCTSHVILSSVNSERFSPEIVALYGFVEYTRKNLKTGEEEMRIGQHAVQCGFSDYAIMELTKNPGACVVFDNGFMYTSRHSPNGKYTPMVIRYTDGPRQPRKRKAYTRKG